MVDVDLEKKLMDLIIGSDGNFIPTRCSESYLEKRGFLSYIKQRYDNNTTDTIAEIIYRIRTGIEVPPVCKTCGGPIKFSKKTKYANFCSQACSNADPEVLAKNKSGVSKSLYKAYAERGNEIKEKRSNTLKEKYGDENVTSPFSIKEIRDKADDSRLARYGVKNTFSIKSLRNEEQRIKNQLDKSVKMWAERGYNIEYFGTDMIRVKNACPIHGDCELTRSQFNLRSRKMYRNMIENCCLICHPWDDAQSGQEKLVSEFLDEIGVDYINSEKTILGWGEIDLYNKDQKIGIEVNGIYYHSYEYWLKTYKEKRNKYYHRNKVEQSESQGIQLVMFWEDQIKSKPAVVKSCVHKLFHKLPIINYKENTLLPSKLSLNDAQVFLNENSLYTYDLTKDVHEAYCLKSGNDIIKVMLFRKSSPYTYYLEEISDIIGYEINIQYNKDLFSFVLNNLKKEGVKEIYGRSHRDYYIKNDYESLGFTVSHYTEPYCFYVSYKRRIETYLPVLDPNENTSIIERERFSCYDSGRVIWHPIYL